MKIFLALVGIGLALVSFQNCGKQFETVTEEENQAGSLANHDNTPHVTQVSKTLALGQDMEFAVFRATLSDNASFQWTNSLNGVDGGCLVKSKSNAANYIINCAKEGTLTITLVAWDNNKRFQLPVLSSKVGAAGATSTMTVTFTIPPNTGTGPWNSTGNLIETYVGQTLEVTNGDNVNHCMHTGGSPCPHGTAFAPGQKATCVITKPYAATNGVYDHISNGGISIVAYDPTVLYQTYCARCHGVLSATTKRGRTAAQISTAITNVGAMNMATENLGKLTRRQIEAIAFAIK